MNTEQSTTAPTFTFRGPWFSPAEAAAYVPCKSVAAFREWRRRWAKRGVLIPARSNGSVAKADIDRALKVRRRISPVSLANLRKRTA